MDEISRSKDKENVVGCYTAVRFKTLFNRHYLVNYWIVKLIKGITCQGCISSNSNRANDRFRNDCCATVSDDFRDKFLSRCEDGTLNCVSSFSQAHTGTCCSSLGLFSPSKSCCGGNKIEMDHTLDSSSGDRSARHSVDFCCSSTSISADVTGDGSTSETLSFRADDIPGSSAGSSPLAWPMRKAEDVNCDTPTMPMTLSFKSDHESVTWEEKKQPHISEMELMKERFAKLLLGEDMSGGGKGVCSALAISNAITNLSATVFGELWRLEPLALERRMMWKREMDWLLSVSDYIVELIPGVQNFPDGSSLEIMVSRPRSDLHINLPALRKLDTMLLEILESFKDTEFWYVDQGIYLADEEGCGGAKRLPQRHEDKWWLPIPRVPSGALTDMARKKLQHQRDCTNQILKAAMSINNNVLSEMEVPDAYLEALPKNGRASLGDIIYRYITAEQFSPDCLLDCLDLSSEHHTLEIANRIEAAIYVWRRRSVSKQCNGKENRPNMKSSWGIVKDLMGDADKREFLADRAESLLLSLKQRFPGLSQTALDMSKIQYNKDVGQSLLESYSRVLESLAFNIMARIDDLLYVDDFAKHSDPTQFSPIPPSVSSRGSSAKKTPPPSVIPVATGTPYASAFTTPNFSPNKAGRPGFLSNKIHSSHLAPIKVLSDYLDGGETKPTEEKENPKEPTLTSLPSSNERGKFWAYPENLGSRKSLM